MESIALPKKIKGGSFKTMDLHPEIYKGITKKGYNQPTPIQRKVIPLALQGKDIVAMARTGSGKSAAFLIPLLNSLHTHSSAGPRALIISPNRELVVQTHRFAQDLGRFTDLRAAVLVGGEALDSQFAALAGEPDLILATPGRILHHIVENQDLNLKTIDYVVFDEADQLFELGFRDQLFSILKHLPQDRQTMLFSATMPNNLIEFSKAGLNEPDFVRLDVETRVSDDLCLSWFLTRQDEKFATLVWLLTELIKLDNPDSNPNTNPNPNPNPNSGKLVLIFVATRQISDFVSLGLSSFGIKNAAIYGSMDQEARTITLNSFRKRKLSVLIVTDVAARGIDIPLLDYVINYDIPYSPKLFIHRVGRVARAGRSGTAYTLLTHDDVAYMVETQDLIGRKLNPNPNPKEGLEFFNLPQFGWFGSIPTSFILQYLEDFNIKLSREIELSEALKRAKNGYKMYLKTRPSANKEVYLKAKDLEIPIHPILAHFKSDAFAPSMDTLEQLKAWRPPQNVLELKRGSEGEALMKVIRVGLDDRIQEEKKRKEKRSEGISHDVSDDVSCRKRRENRSSQDEKVSRVDDTADDVTSKKFMIPSRPSKDNQDVFKINSSNQSLTQAIMDLVPDEANDIIKRRTIQRWDAKKKRFVTINPGESVKVDGVSVKNDTGSLVSSINKTDAFDQWKSRSKGGVVNGEGLSLGNREKVVRKRGKKVNNVSSFGNLGAQKGGELKSSAEILKQRKVKEKRKAYLESKKGKRGRKNDFQKEIPIHGAKQRSVRVKK
ncbi:hypothetical protein P9112_005138 [Eukaryota sp. TZLM1-RC]